MRSQLVADVDASHHGSGSLGVSGVGDSTLGWLGVWSLKALGVECSEEFSEGKRLYAALEDY